MRERPPPRRPRAGGAPGPGESRARGRPRGAALPSHRPLTPPVPQVPRERRPPARLSAEQEAVLGAVRSGKSVFFTGSAGEGPGHSHRLPGESPGH